jgi:hypothetical protein
VRQGTALVLQFSHRTPVHSLGEVIYFFYGKRRPEGKGWRWMRFWSTYLPKATWRSEFAAVRVARRPRFDPSSPLDNTA